MANLKGPRSLVGGGTAGQFQGPLLPNQDEKVFRQTGRTVINNPAPSGGGGGGGGGGGSSDGGGNNNPPQESAPSKPTIDFTFINKAISDLDAEVGRAEGLFSEQQNNIEAEQTSELARQEQTTQGLQTTLGKNKVTQQNLAGTAKDEARRAFSEIQQGLQARFGGTTGTGAFATELAGREALGNVSQINQTLVDNIGAIDDKLVQVEEFGKIALEEIRNETQNRISDARANLNQNLSAIRAQKGAFQSQKAQLANQALQIFQDTVNQVNARNTQFQQQLFLQQQSAKQSLSAIRQRAQTAVEKNTDKAFSSGNQGTNVGTGAAAAGAASRIGGKTIGADEDEFQF